LEPHVYLSFVVATAIMISLPGPSVLLTVAHGIAVGWRRAIATVAGATAGVAVQLGIAVVGLASLLQVVAQWFEVLRWLGVAYLVFLGVRQWQSAARALQIDATPPSGSNLFIQGLVVTIPNPKSLIFIAAFLPQFIDPARPIVDQFVLIVPTFLVITFVVTSIWAVAAGNAGRVLRSPRGRRSLARVSGGLMITAGVGLAVARRGA
jgi:threonine/homoserine/homoserine lactone efflux protein